MAGTPITAVPALPTTCAEYRAMAEQNNLVDDVETVRSAASDSVVAVTELMADHATFKTAVDSLKTLADELKADFNLLRTNLLNAAFGAAGLAEGTNAATIKTVNAISYAIGGQLYLKAATDNIAITATAQQAISTFCLYLVSINAGGTVTTTKGTELGTDTAVLPARPASEAVIGAFKIATDGVTTYTGGTTDNGAAGITDTYYDVAWCTSGADANTAIAAADASAAPATLSASVPSATAINAAGDMTAAKIQTEQFEGTAKEIV